MTAMVSFQATSRNKAGTGEARAIRQQGKVPAVIYGGGETIMVTLDQKAITQEAHKAGFMSKLFTISLDGDNHQVLAREIQYHPVTDAIIHADFQRIKPGEKVKVFVPVDFRNAEKSPGLKKGGVLNIVRRDLELMCEPSAIPEKIEVDLTGLQIGHSIHIDSITLPEGVTPYITDRNFTVATIAGAASKTEDETAAPVAVSPADVPATAQKAPVAGAAPAAPAKADKK